MMQLTIELCAQTLTLATFIVTIIVFLLLLHLLFFIRWWGMWRCRCWRRWTGWTGGFFVYRWMDIITFAVWFHWNVQCIVASIIRITAAAAAVPIVVFLFTAMFLSVFHLASAERKHWNSNRSAERYTTSYRRFNNIYYHNGGVNGLRQRFLYPLYIVITSPISNRLQLGVMNQRFPLVCRNCYSNACNQWKHHKHNWSMACSIVNSNVLNIHTIYICTRELRNKNLLLKNIHSVIVKVYRQCSQRGICWKVLKSCWQNYTDVTHTSGMNIQVQRPTHPI